MALRGRHRTRDERRVGMIVGCVGEDDFLGLSAPDVGDRDGIGKRLSRIGRSVAIAVIELIGLRGCDLWGQGFDRDGTILYFRFELIGPTGERQRAVPRSGACDPDR